MYTLNGFEVFARMEGENSKWCTRDRTGKATKGVKEVQKSSSNNGRMATTLRENKRCRRGVAQGEKDLWREMEARMEELQKREEVMTKTLQELQQVMGNYEEALERIKEKLLEMESDMNHIVHMNNQMACPNQELVVLNAMKDKFIDTHLKMGCTFFPPPDEGNDNDTSDSSD